MKCTKHGKYATQQHNKHDKFENWWSIDQVKHSKKLIIEMCEITIITEARSMHKYESHIINWVRGTLNRYKQCES